MRNSTLAYARSVGICLALASPAAAQEKPLSVIDWLDRNPGQAIPAALPGPAEPPVARSGEVPRVETRPLDTRAIRQIGLVPPSVTGLPPDLWLNSDAKRLGRLLAQLPDLDLPAAQSLLYTLLLTEALGPKGDASAEDAFTLARVATLVRFGALDPALALVEQAGVTRDRAHFKAYMDISLLTGTEDAACAILNARPHLAPEEAHRIFCTARAGDWATAALLFDGARALSLVDGAEAELLDRFLNPDLFDGADPLPVPGASDITPLSFRLHETIGEALPTRALPRAFAVADLRDLAGWKAQLEAAERLTRTGALPDNRLLGIYSARLPAASGGIWDRVEALQRFDTALAARSPDAVAKTLPAAWDRLQEAGLEVPFSVLFADQLAGLPLPGRAGRIADAMRLLSPAYETAAQEAGAGLDPALRAIALGDVTGVPPATPLAEAVFQGFAAGAARDDLIQMAAEGRLGEAILRALHLLQDGATGDTAALAGALGTLRALGLEDTARRAGLQLMLLDRGRG